MALDLELRALGGELFVCGREDVRATALGELVLERARVVLPAVCELQEEALRVRPAGGGGLPARRDARDAARRARGSAGP